MNTKQVCLDVLYQQYEEREAFLRKQIEKDPFDTEFSSYLQGVMFGLRYAIQELEQPKEVVLEEKKEASK